MNNLEQTHTSKELFKKLKEGGCELDSYNFWEKYNYNDVETKKLIESVWLFGGSVEYLLGETIVLCDYPSHIVEPKLEEKIPAYDILNDLCCKYAKEMFGEEIIMDMGTKGRSDIVHSRAILNLLQQNKKQEAEEYIWGVCLFNPKNK